MAKIGTAVFEIKPVLNQEALAEVCAHIEREIADAVKRGLAGGSGGTPQIPQGPLGPIIAHVNPGATSTATVNLNNAEPSSEEARRWIRQPYEGLA